MKLLLLLLAAAAVVIPSQQDAGKVLGFGLPQKTEEVRCGDLGTFSSAAPFFNITHRPLSVVPDCKLADNIFLHLNTRDTPIQTEILNPYKPSSISQSKLKPSKPIKIVIHGFIDHYMHVNWVNMVKGLLDFEDCNVIRVDWSAGNRPPYTQGTANTRLVGAYVAKLILLLRKDFKVSLDQIHIIGHSLGAHTAGYAGKYVSDSSNGAQIARITGLDPAGPFFSHMPEVVRLDLSDAKFVDTIISDGEDVINWDAAMSFGSPQAMGHINFRPNGGFNQPGCRHNAVQTTGDRTSNSSSGFRLPTPALVMKYFTDFGADIAGSCSHGRAILLFTESLNRTLPAMRAAQCEPYTKFLSGACSDCRAHGCTAVGIAANASLAEKGKAKNFYFTTTASTPFATTFYKITFSLTPVKGEREKQSATQEGHFFIMLKGKKETVGPRALTKDAVKMVPGGTYSAFFDVRGETGEIMSMSFMWKSKLSMNIFGPKSINVASDIKLTDQSGGTKTFRLAKTKIEDNTQVEAMSI